MFKNKLANLVNDDSIDPVRWAHAFCEQYAGSTVRASDPAEEENENPEGSLTRAALFNVFCAYAEAIRRDEREKIEGAIDTAKRELLGEGEKVARIGTESMGARRGSHAWELKYDVVLNKDNIIIKNRNGPINCPAEKWMINDAEDIDD